MGYQQYPSYKPTEVRWVDQLPDDWKISRLKNISDINVHSLNDSTDPDYELKYVDIGNVTLHGLENEPEEMRFEDAPSRARRIVQPGDTIISTVRTYLQAVAHFEEPPSNLIASTGFAVLHPRPFIHPRFLYYLVLTPRLINDVMAHSVGVSYPAISPLELAGLPVWVPSLDEQKTIVDFLDHATVIVDALVRKKQQLIKRLNEKRTAIISHAVTRGLDPQVAMKDSDIFWIGQFPAHWETARLKFISYVQTGLTLGKRYQGRELATRPYLRVANVQDGFLDLSTITEVDIPIDDVSKYELRLGDVLMTEGGDFDKLGRGYVWEGQIDGCLHQNHVFAVRPNQERLTPYYLSALMTSAYGKNYFTYMSQQTTNLATINKTSLGDFPCPLPPLKEQKHTVAWLNEVVGEIDSTTKKIETTIRKLQEYRIALISATVTGKIDVGSLV